MTMTARAHLNEAVRLLNDRDYCLSYAADRDKEIKRLQERHRGVRPGWVSAEISIEGENRRQAKDKAEELELRALKHILEAQKVIEGEG